MLKKIFYAVFPLGFFMMQGIAYGQLLDSITLADIEEYRGLEEAMKEPDKVIKLNLKHQRLDSFPVEIFKFKYLQVLNLSKNRLRHIPGKINELKFLQDLDLSKNRIERLPGELCEMKNLRYLRLGQNELWALPDSIGKLHKLRYLDLWSNNLTQLPASVSRLKQLREVDMRVIQMNEEKQQAIQSLLPGVKINFSSPCDCDH